MFVKTKIIMASMFSGMVDAQVNSACVSSDDPVMVKRISFRHFIQL